MAEVMKQVEPTLDEGQRRFCDDVVEIIRQYNVEGRPIHDEMLAKVAEAKEMERKARAEYERAALEINDKYTARIWKAAEIRKAKSEHPEYIAKAAQNVTFSLGGFNNTYIRAEDPMNAERVILNAERDRMADELTMAMFTSEAPIIM